VAHGAQERHEGSQSVSRELASAKYDVVVRIATADDAALIADLGARTFAETFGPDNRPEDLAAHLSASFGLDRQREELADPSMCYLLATIDDDVAGYAMLRDGGAPPCVQGPEPVELVRFYVTSPWHGRGVAQALMSSCVAHAHGRRGRTMWLGVWERNARAITFYEKAGFRDVGSKSFWVGSDRQSDRVMVRDIGNTP
jgi:diamine N-acetyltransferase